MEEKEIWKEVRNYEGFYEVSNKGRVRSVDRTIFVKDKKIHLKSKILALNSNKGGYLLCDFHKGGVKVRRQVHRVVAETFLKCENPSEMHVDHINTIRTDNRVRNLRFVTRKENNNNPLTISKLIATRNSPEFQEKRLLSRARNQSERAPRRVFMYTQDKVYVRDFISCLRADTYMGFYKGAVFYAATKKKGHSYGGYKWYFEKIEP